MAETKILWENNLKALAAKQPEFAEKLDRYTPSPDVKLVSADNTGDPVLMVGNISLHSRKDPIKEARLFAKTDPVTKARSDGKIPVIFGLGLGYHIFEIIKLFDQIAVVEPNLDVIFTALKTFDWSAVFPGMILVEKAGDLPSSVIADASPITHRPSQRLSPNHHARFEAALSGADVKYNAVQAEKLKILVVTPIVGGSLPIAYHAARALNSMGHEVTTIDLSVIEPYFRGIQNASALEQHKDHTANSLMRFIGEYTALTAESVKPHLVLAIAQTPLDVRALNRIRKMGIRSAFWFVEDGRLMTYFTEMASAYDYFFHIQGSEMERKLQGLGVQHYSYLPMAADPEEFRPIEDESRLHRFRADVSFMGAGYPNRRNVFQDLMEYDLKIWGTEWDMANELGQRVQDCGRRIPTNETPLIYNAAKINLNLHSSVFEPGLDLSGQFLNPRTFEIAACGGFQLVDRRMPLWRHFDIENEIVSFTSIDELKQQIDFYLNEPNLRKEIGEKARQRVLSEHTYQHRMDSMLQFIRESGI